MMIKPVSRLSANDAAFGWMNAANALSCCNGGNSKGLELQMLQDSFNYKACSALADTQEKLQKENIKRSFSTFA